MSAGVPDPEVGRWRRALTLFEELRDLPEGPLAARLSEIEEGDDQLGRRVRDLLAADAEADDTLDRPVIPGSTAGPSGELREGGKLGAYLLRRRLGQGGMGEVWEAEQTEPVRRRVAVKVIREGLGGDEILERFRNERQALALMSHPSIAAVLDAGATDEGRPYFVMELVQGLPITEYCDRRRVGLTERLELFRQVCAAVQHAHQKGVVHRDLKASNILVGEDRSADEEEPLGSAREVSKEAATPRPKVIDFGIVKVLSGPMAELVARTEDGRLVGTPQAMSPEQAEGRDVDTRSDVYSLGALLHELLCGRPPLELAGLPILQALAAVREQEPAPPSRCLATSPEAEKVATRRSQDRASLERALRGDLDWIVAKALDKQRSRRYTSPAELSADLGRYLADEPVAAGPPSTLYRLQKFVRRHRVSVSAAVAVLVALLCGLVVAAAGWDQARREADAAHRATELLMSTFEIFDPTAPSVALDAAMPRAQRPEPEQLLALGVEGARSQLADRPVLRARVLATLGRVYRNRGDTVRARPLLEEALALRREQHGEHHPEVAKGHRELGWSAFAEGDHATALEHLERAVEVGEQTRSLPVEDHVVALSDLSLAMWKLGRARQAVPHVDRAVELAEGAVAEADGRGVDLALASGLYVRGLLATRLGRFGAAARDLERSLELRTEHLGPRDLQVGWVLLDLGWLDRVRRRTREAKARLTRAVEIFEQRLGEIHPDLAFPLNAKAYALFDLGELEQARATFTRAFELRRSALPESHPEITASLEGVARIDLARGETAAAATAAQQVLDVRRRTYGSNHVETGYALEVLARASWRLGKADRGRQLAEESWQVLRGTLGEGHPRLASIVLDLSIAAQVGGDLEAAGHWAELAIRQAEAAGEPGGRVAQVAAYNLACLASRRGELTAALDHLRDAVARGYDGPAWHDDPDLEPLKSDPATAAQLAALMSSQH